MSRSTTLQQIRAGRVIALIRAESPDGLIECGRALQAVQYLVVSMRDIVLTNGLDEGIMALAVAQFRTNPGTQPGESIVPEPAFEIFKFDTALAGGQLDDRGDEGRIEEELPASVAPDPRASGPRS